MAKYGSSGFSVLLIDGYNLLANKVKNFRHEIEALLEGSTGLGDGFEEHTPTGMQKASLAQDGAFFDDVANRMHTAMAAGTATNRVLCFAYAGNTVGQPFVGLEGTYACKYGVLGTVGQLTKANASYVVSGRLDRGVILQDWSAETVDLTGAWVDNAAASAAGGAGYLQVSDSFGSCQFRIEHSPDQSTISTLMTFTTVTASPTAQRLTVTGTIHRYTRFVAQLAGGSPSASQSPSASASPSASQSPSASASLSASPSASKSPSASASGSPSASKSPSASTSTSPSASASPSSSVSPTDSPSTSPSASVSPSPSPSGSFYGSATVFCGLGRF